MVIAVGFLGMGGWASTAKLASGSIAPGVVAVSSNKQTVQHLEGGIISEIVVREGDHVKIGDTLVILETTRPASTLSFINAQYLSTLGHRDRLLAERDGLSSISFDKGLATTEANLVKQGQINVFKSR